MEFETEQHYKSGLELFSKGRYGEASQELKRAIKLSPKFPDLHNQLGMSYHFNGQFEEAVKSFHAAIELNPRYVEAYLNLAISLNELGRYEEAVKYFNKASEAEDIKDGLTLSIRNRLAETHTKLGITYSDIGYHYEAVEEFGKALSINPHYPRHPAPAGQELSEPEQFSQDHRRDRDHPVLQPQLHRGHDPAGGGLSEGRPEGAGPPAVG